ncbi:unnamed protein product [Cyclocybe aegerita]|uniref:alpha-amylase n=1 Tax=Cyclocybe aegerita TaxID=1973307 RepID=A0A8S0WDY7_CYCAE|nr:unnamed protein product [Cyclocybe aegerita]
MNSQSRSRQPRGQGKNDGMQLGDLAIGELNIYPPFLRATTTMSLYLWILRVSILHSFLTILVSAATAEEWRGRRIYQVLTDRFAREDNTAAPCDTSERTYCGGTWKGITSHLDYIQQLGFDAVWISPIVANVEGVTAYGEAYHGYWPKDITKLNENFGTADDLKTLSQALHSRGMYLMVDVVVNHFVVIPSADGSLDFSSSVPFSSSSSFHPRCTISDADYTQNQTAVELCWLGDDNLPLADLNTEDPAIVQTLLDWVKETVEEYSIDGLRIDTVKHVRKDFWPAFAKAAGVYTLGEVLIDDVDYAAPYTQVIDSVLDYPTFFAVTSAFKSNTGNVTAIPDVVTRSQTAYDGGLFISGSFLENHDQPRFQSLTTDQSLVKNAIAWTFVQDGIPILYSGQEQGYEGGADPANREALWPSGYLTDKSLVTHVKALNNARKLAGAANTNFHTTPVQFISQTDSSTLAISKPPLLTLLTNAGETPSSSPEWTIPASAGLFGAGTMLVDVLTCQGTTVDSDGRVSVRASAGAPKVFLPATVLTKDGGLCPDAATSGAAQRGWSVFLMSLSIGVVLLGTTI